MSNKIVFIPILQGAEAKNILRTRLYQLLLSDTDIRIVFFVASEAKAEYYKKEFSHPQVLYEVFGAYKRPRGSEIFEYLKFRLLRTSTIDLRRKRARDMGGSIFGYVASYILTRACANRLCRRVVRFFDYYCIRDNAFSQYFDRYSPQLIVTAHLFGEIETSMLREAKKRGVRSIGIVNSWDKLTGRAIMRLLPDILLVFNEIQKKEALRHADIDEKNIIVVGALPFDYYAYGTPSTRAEFTKRLGVEPDKKILVYAPLGRSNSASDWDILDLLQSCMRDGKIKHSAVVLVRYPPNDFIDENEAKKRPSIIFDVPGVRFTKKRGFGLDWDMTQDDLQHLLDTVAHADVFVSYGSTLILDAAMLDKPIININFEMRKNIPLSQRPTSFYETEHYQKALRTGGIRMVSTADELIEWINVYFSHPECDHESRLRLRDEQCWRFDGKAAERIADVIFSAMRQE
ncbi:MAG: hypothetical protein COU47_00685 [Candidatus Niyogibacteria bacterium CG10_big_fil_rev_8_21_14_0_10_46_36]|uniref:Glycosyltransferase subfamily 4-like N-terminal domain-containing protein n=1 Tax=Candidatus Niyogibacteria bacterium CG10_big_fil_rev_8_21_14_0_10_46_36 TaxID=1974726 RepID=A0A2H0TG53_9BACT|nr:MAG: hypothetical protein COU47_00685 [Candidatus Niyogibacteria bacterium CG10_big_fil_rev_8_21_14_0_10_46_36]